VVIFDENVSFDHYFATYPVAGVHTLKAANLLAPNNPNSRQPALLGRNQALTCDQDHGYADEQLAFNGGDMNLFPEHTNGGGCADPGIVMDYYDGTTVTALWNLAQGFAMSDEFYGSTFGPSTPGALNLIAGQTHGASSTRGGVENGTMIGDPDPQFDDCSDVPAAQMTGTNIGDELTTAGVTWGWFQGGFRRTSAAPGSAGCASQHANIGHAVVTDYSPHHEPFMYYASTANQAHRPPSSVAAIGHEGDQANHQYDLADFDAAIHASNLPAVSFLKAASFEDGHAGYSDPLDEQSFIVRTLDEIELSQYWDSTAVIITYDDSDGWYDHEHAAITQFSDALSDPNPGPPARTGICRTAPPGAGEFLDRCGPGPRLPLLVVSPWVDQGKVDHTELEQASIIRFIEDNWGVPRLGNQSFDARAGGLQALFNFNLAAPRAPKLFLDPVSGAPLPGLPPSDIAASPGINPPPAPAPTAVPTVSPTPGPSVTPPFKIKPKLSVTAKRSGRRLTLKLKVTNLKASNGRITLTVKLRRKGKTLASSLKHTVRSGRVTLVLKAKKPLRKGRYTLAVRVVQGKATVNLTRTLTLR
jgi:phospholipase C